MSKYSVFFLIFLFPAILSAQDSSQTAKSVDDWEKSLTFGFNLTSGNSNTTLINLGSRAKREHAGEVWLVEGSGSFGETENDSGVDETTQKDASLNAEYQKLISERTYYGFGLFAETDQVADVDYRVILKPSFGYYLIKNDKMDFNIEAGPSYIFEKQDGDQQDYVALRIAERFEWKLSDTSKFFQSSEALFSVEDSDDYIIKAEAGIEAAINSSLSLVATLENEYNNLPAEDKERNDLSLITSLKCIF